MRRIFNYVPSKTVLRRGAIAMIVLLVAVLLGSVWAVLWLAKENDTLDERDRQSLSDRAQLRRDLTAEQAAREALAEQLRGLGEQPVLEPEDVPDDADVIVVPGPKGDRGASCIEEIGYPRCRGTAGDDGSDGPTGANGSDGADGQPGPPGPAGKDGAPGADGKDGVDGKDGRGIEKTYCNDAGRWEITYTDGTTSDGGICRIDPGNSGGTQ